MAIRTSEKSTSQLGRLRDRIRSTLFTRGGGDADDTEVKSGDDPAPTNPDAPGNLFHCSTCGTVYIDVEKRTCSGCDEDVEQVRSRLDSARAR